MIRDLVAWAFVLSFFVGGGYGVYKVAEAVWAALRPAVCG